MVLSLCLFSCLSLANYSQNQNHKNFQKKCIDWFELILEVQNFRSIERKKINFFIQEFKDGEISSSQYQSLYRDWIRSENNLASLVNRFYTAAYDHGCFKDLEK